MNFILKEMTYLRYFIPLIIEGNKRGVKSVLYVGRNNKYNNPWFFAKELQALSIKHNFDLKDMSEANNCKGLVFVSEGVDADRLSRSDTNIVSLTYMTDFSLSMNNYTDLVDHIIMPSKPFADYLGCHNPKNVYLGSPKYDVDLDKEQIIKKYNLSNNKKALFIAPRLRDISRIDIPQLFSILKDQGFDILVKTRGKDPMPSSHKGDYYFIDDCWFPHTSMELTTVSDLIVNFSSTAIKEFVLLKKPILNFHIKPFDIPLEHLYHYEYCEMFEDHIDEEKIKNAINRLTTSDFGDTFNKAIEDFLFTGNSSKRILDYLGVS